MLLCPNHHSEVTRRRIDQLALLKANENPFNHTSANTTPYRLHYGQDEDAQSNCRIIIGETEITAQLSADRPSVAAVVLCDRSMLEYTLEDGHLLLSASLFDAAGKPKIIINKNELVVSTSVWDVKYIGERLTIYDGRSSVFIEMGFEVPSTVRVSRGKIRYRDRALEIVGPDLIITQGGLSRRCRLPNIHGFRRAIVID
jgi:hypothetical protein